MDFIKNGGINGNHCSIRSLLHTWRAVRGFCCASSRAQVKYFVLIAALCIASTLAAFPQDERGPDGHYHAPDGEVQPEMCDNSFKNQHPCECSRATSCDPKDQKAHPSNLCKTYCRTQACSCLSACSS